MHDITRERFIRGARYITGDTWYVYISLDLKKIQLAWLDWNLSREKASRSLGGKYPPRHHRNAATCR